MAALLNSLYFAFTNSFLPKYTLKTEVLKITLEVLFLTLPKSARRDNTWSVTLTPHEV